MCDVIDLQNMAGNWLGTQFGRHTKFLVLLLVLVNGGGAEDIPSPSFISPLSSSEHKAVMSASATQTVAPSFPTASRIPGSSGGGERERRSAEPVLTHGTATGGIEELLRHRQLNHIEGNDVEVLVRDYRIQPSRTILDDSPNAHSGEFHGAPQARSIPLEEPLHPHPTALIPGLTIATLSPEEARGRPPPNHDIQDIITGIVKLLNGNVNVQANTAPPMGRPLRPLSTRINNRGPPRITDVPALPPDFDLPAPPLPPPPLGQMPPPPSRMPTPYPFDIPNTSPKRPYIPLPGEVMKRPGLYRPVTINPWNRKPVRRPPNRRPVQTYRPPPASSEDLVQAAGKPSADVLTLDFGHHLGDLSEEITPGSDNSSKPSKEELGGANIETEASAGLDKETLEFEKNKEKSSSKMDKRTKTSQVVADEIKTTSSSSVSKENSSPGNSSTSSLISSSDITPTKTSSVISTTTTIDVSDYSQILSNSSLEKEEGHMGEATPVLETSILDVSQTLKEVMSSSTLSTTPTESLPSVSTSIEIPTIIKSLEEKTATIAVNQSETSTQQQGYSYFPYKPRPGIVLDDTEYKPGGNKRKPIMTRPPIGQLGDIFDVTVSAIQGPGGGTGNGKPYIIPVDLTQQGDVITSPVGDEGFVSIDGKRTYLNLFGDPTKSSSSIKPTTASANQITGTGYAVVETEKPKGVVKPTQRRPLYGRPRPTHPPVRIDTCIVGDDSTCDGSQHEICRTESGVSACHCRPGHARRKHRDPCRKIVSVLMSLRVDKIYERRVVWASELTDKSSDSYQQLSYEAERALESAMSMTPFSDEFLGAKVNTIYKGERSAGQAGVFVNLTLELEENSETSRPTVRNDIQKHLLGVIQRRSNNVGKSALWVDSPPGSVSNLQDLDECSSPELHDCHSLAKCINVFGGFTCECGDGYRDLWADNKYRAGRECEQCSAQRCNNRGECRYQNGQEVCVCSGNYYGSQCELDGEVLGVAIGASVAAVIIIGLTLVCLVMWSRKWNREQKAVVGSPVFGYMATASNTVKAPVVGGPPYQLTLEDRLRWAQIADVMAQTNHYAPEPVIGGGPTRPSSAMFGGGFPPVALSRTGTLQHHGTLPPVPLPRMNLPGGGRAASMHGGRPMDSSSSEEEDKIDLLGRSFQVPRPKSRSSVSIANQSGIYYDVDYDQNEIYKQAGGIPLSTYSMGRPQYFRH